MTGGLFVTGTDTEVGKTAVAAGLIEALTAEGTEVHPLKPVETDAPPDAWPRDAACLAQAAGLEAEDPEAVCPVAYPEPLAPSVAARRAGEEIDVDRLTAAYQRLREGHELTLVEGAGGLLVPVTEEVTMADLARRWELPVLVVARSGLGTLNHTALTVEVARAHGLAVLGVVLNRWPEEPDVATRTNPAELERLADVEVLGRVPELPDVDTDEARIGGLGEAVGQHVDLFPFHEITDRSTTHARA